MKKLMIALGAAASMAWCANADVVSAVAGGTFVSGTDFNGLPANTTLTNATETTGSFDGVVFWKAPDGYEISSTIKAKEDPSDKYLAVDETEVLERTMNGVYGDPQSLTNSSVYFTADVQFTASDETSGTNMVTSGDKLLVWLRATEAVEAVMDGDTELTPAVPATTNLIITAASGNAGTPAADYIVATTGEHGVAIDPARWYKLTIKAVKDGIENYETAKFTVELDGEQLSAATNGASVATTTFNSLVGSGDGASATITSVGFKGTGALDNLEFGTFTEVAQVCTVSVTVTGGAGAVTVDGTEVDEFPANVECPIGGAINITVEVEDGYVVKYGANTYVPVENVCTIPVDLTNTEPGATVTVALSVEEAGSATTVDLTLTGVDAANAVVTTSPEIITGLTAGTEVTITATPNSNYTYTGVDCTGWTLSGTAITKTVTVNANMEVAVPAAVAATPSTTWPAAWTDSTGYSEAYATKLSAWATAKGVTDVSALPKEAENAFLLNVAPTDNTELAVTTIVVEGGKVKITTNKDLSGVNGVPYVLTGDTPTTVTTPVAVATEGEDAGKIEFTPGDGETKKFYKVGVGYAVPAPAPATQE